MFIVWIKAFFYHLSFSSEQIGWVNDSIIIFYFQCRLIFTVHEYIPSIGTLVNISYSSTSSQEKRFGNTLTTAKCPRQIHRCALKVEDKWWFSLLCLEIMVIFSHNSQNTIITRKCNTITSGIVTLMNGPMSFLSTSSHRVDTSRKTFLSKYPPQGRGTALFITIPW